MKNKYLILSVCCYCIATLPVVAQTIPAKLDSLLDAYAKVWDYTGCVLVATKGAVLFEKGYGYKYRFIWISSGLLSDFAWNADFP
jgi:hypothetical protein